MKRAYLFIVPGLLILISCKKGIDETPASSEHYMYFLSMSNDYIDGEINDQLYTWRLTTSDQYVAVNKTTKAGQQTQSFGFYTILCDAKVEILTPYYLTKAQLFDDILSVGKKQLGGGDGDFRIKVTIPIGHLQTYNCVGTHTTSGDQPDSYFEILKTETAFDTVKQKQYKRIWLKFCATLYHENTNDAIKFTEGILIARFFE